MAKSNRGVGMKFVIIYSSRYGNGKKCVDIVDEELKAKGHEVQVINAPEADPAKLPQADIYIFSGATEAFNIAVGIRKYLKKLPEMKEQKYALISTHAMKKAIALNKMEKLLTKKKMVKVDTIDFRIGDGSTEGNGLPEGYEDRLRKWVEGIG
jgi:flavodoxin